MYLMPDYIKGYFWKRDERKDGGIGRGLQIHL